MDLPQEIVAALAPFAPLFADRTWLKAQLLAVGALPQFLAPVAAAHFPVTGVPRGDVLARELAGVYLRGLAPGVTSHAAEAP